MVSSINTILANTPSLRNEAEQPSQNISVAEIEAAREAASDTQALERPQFVQAPFISPVVSIDSQFNTAILVLRNSDDGEIIDQIPSESALIARQRDESSPILVQTDDGTSNIQNNVAQPFSTSDLLQSSPTISVSTEAEINNSSVSANSLAAIQTFAQAQNLGQVGTVINETA